MIETSERGNKVEKALLIGVAFNSNEIKEVQTLLEELEELVETLGIKIVRSEIISVRTPNAGLLMGKGKAEYVHELAKAHECDVIIFDNELSPGQQRNWEKLTDITVIDRQEIIIDIFAQRAQTKEAVLQVELARMEYMLPRLKRAWTHLSRQRGGGAMQRGEGEQQLQVDRRLIRKRITTLKKELSEVIQHRGIQRKRRMKVPLPTAAIIGYTNAGKSSLLNALTGSEVLSEDKLFATLDPTTRRLKLPTGQVLLLTDTVGFVRRLPHRLVEAFKATLEEAIVGEFLIHVVDLCSPDLEHHMATTSRVMAELGVEDKPTLIAFNKIDKINDPVLINSLKAQYPDSVFISAVTQEGLDQLIEKFEAKLEHEIVRLNLLFPHDRYDLVSQLHELGAVRSEKAEAEGVIVSANIPKRLIDLFKPYSLDA